MPIVNGQQVICVWKNLKVEQVGVTLVPPQAPAVPPTTAWLEVPWASPVPPRARAVPPTTAWLEDLPFPVAPAPVPLETLETLELPVPPRARAVPPTAVVLEVAKLREATWVTVPSAVVFPTPERFVPIMVPTV